MVFKTLFKLLITLIFVGIFLLAIYVVMMNHISLHEAIHKSIWEDYDINSTIEINFKTISGTTTADLNEYNNKCNDYCKFQHNLNDIVGYNIVTLVLFTLVIFAGLVIIKMSD